MKVLIADDEPLARQRLRRLLEECAGWTVCAEAVDGDQAWALCQSEQPDLLILDIRMPGLDGLQLAHKVEQLSPPPAIIFSTAYAEHALHAFQTPATAYLLKPVNRAKLQAALAKVQALNRAQAPANEADTAAHLLVRRSGQLRRLPLSSVIYVQAEQKLSSVHHQDGVDLVEDSLAQLEARFPELLRVHRNTLVHLPFVMALNRQPDGYNVDLRGGIRLPVSRRLVTSVREALAQHSGMG